MAAPTTNTKFEIEGALTPPPCTVRAPAPSPAGGEKNGSKGDLESLYSEYSWSVWEDSLFSGGSAEATIGVRPKQSEEENAAACGGLVLGGASTMETVAETKGAKTAKPMAAEAKSQFPPTASSALDKLSSLLLMGTTAGRQTTTTTATNAAGTPTSNPPDGIEIVFECASPNTRREAPAPSEPAKETQQQQHLLTRIPFLSPKMLLSHQTSSSVKRTTVRTNNSARSIGSTAATSPRLRRALQQQSYHEDEEDSTVMMGGTSSTSSSCCSDIDSSPSSYGHAYTEEEESTTASTTWFLWGNHSDTATVYHDSIEERVSAILTSLSSQKSCATDDAASAGDVSVIYEALPTAAPTAASVGGGEAAPQHPANAEATAAVATPGAAAAVFRMLWRKKVTTHIVADAVRESPRPTSAREHLAATSGRTPLTRLDHNHHNAASRFFAPFLTKDATSGGGLGTTSTADLISNSKSLLAASFGTPASTNPVTRATLPSPRLPAATTKPQKDPITDTTHAFDQERHDALPLISPPVVRRKKTFLETPCGYEVASKASSTTNVPESNTMESRRLSADESAGGETTELVPANDYPRSRQTPAAASIDEFKETFTGPFECDVDGIDGEYKPSPRQFTFASEDENDGPAPLHQEDRAPVFSDEEERAYRGDISDNDNFHDTASCGLADDDIEATVVSADVTMSGASASASSLISEILGSERKPPRKMTILKAFDAFKFLRRHNRKNEKTIPSASDFHQVSEGIQGHKSIPKTERVSPKAIAESLKLSVRERVPANDTSASGHPDSGSLVGGSASKNVSTSPKVLSSFRQTPVLAMTPSAASPVVMSAGHPIDEPKEMDLICDEPVDPVIGCSLSRSRSPDASESRHGIEEDDVRHLPSPGQRFTTDEQNAVSALLEASGPPSVRRTKIVEFADQQTEALCPRHTSPVRLSPVEGGGIETGIVPETQDLRIAVAPPYKLTTTTGAVLKKRQRRSVKLRRVQTVPSTSLSNTGEDDADEEEPLTFWSDSDASGRRANGLDIPIMPRTDSACETILSDLSGVDRTTLHALRERFQLPTNSSGSSTAHGNDLNNRMPISPDARSQHGRHSPASIGASPRDDELGDSAMSGKERLASHSSNGDGRREGAGSSMATPELPVLNADLSEKVDLIHMLKSLRQKIAKSPRRPSCLRPTHLDIEAVSILPTISSNAFEVAAPKEPEKGTQPRTAGSSYNDDDANIAALRSIASPQSEDDGRAAFLFRDDGSTDSYEEATSTADPSRNVPSADRNMRPSLDDLEAYAQIEPELMAHEGKTGKAEMSPVGGTATEFSTSARNVGQRGLVSSPYVEKGLSAAYSTVQTDPAPNSTPNQNPKPCPPTVQLHDLVVIASGNDMTNASADHATEEIEPLESIEVQCELSESLYPSVLSTDEYDDDEQAEPSFSSNADQPEDSRITSLSTDASTVGQPQSNSHDQEEGECHDTAEEAQGNECTGPLVDTCIEGMGDRQPVEKQVPRGNIKANLGKWLRKRKAAAPRASSTIFHPPSTKSASSSGQLVMRRKGEPPRLVESPSSSTTTSTTTAGGGDTPEEGAILYPPSILRKKSKSGKLSLNKCFRKLRKTVQRTKKEQASE